MTLRADEFVNKRLSPKMEEVDAILLTQLREIGCDLDEDVQGIANLTSVQLMKCVCQCLSNIVRDGSTIVPTDQVCESMNMSSKYKVATQFTECIKGLGYKADLGYQTFMYANEHDIRRLLLFLIETIARDESKTGQFEVDEQASERLSLSQRLKQFHSNQTVWIPYSTYDDEEEDKVEAYLTPHTRLSYSSIHASRSLNFNLRPFLSKTLATRLQQYGKHKLSDPVASRSLLPSSAADILEWNSFNWKNLEEDEDDEDVDVQRLYKDNKKKRPLVSRNQQMQMLTRTPEEEVNKVLTTEQDKQETGAKPDKEQVYSGRVAQLESQLAQLEEKVINLKQAQDQLKTSEALYREQCKHLEAAFKSKDELQADVDTIRAEIEQIAASWETMQLELRHELKLKKEESHAQSEQVTIKLKRLRQLKKLIAANLKDVAAKEALEEELGGKMPTSWPPSRDNYTKRIVEIIDNVARQNAETRKVLLETKGIQREINTLEGKIRRCLAVADELVFREAKHNDWNKACYLLLARLQANCNLLIDNVEAIGATRRDTRKLEEMVENEKSRSTASNLSRIKADTQQIELENEQLRTQIELKRNNNNGDKSRVA